MILVIVGTQDMQFDRLIEQVIDYANKDITKEKIVIQAGCSTQFSGPEHVQYYDYIEHDLLQDYMSQARCLIVHAGVGTIMEALRLEKPLIVVPRLQKFHEHHNDHQLEIATSFAKSGYVLTGKKISDLIQCAKDYKYVKYPFDQSRIVAYLHEIINKE